MTQNIPLFPSRWRSRCHAFLLGILCCAAVGTAYGQSSFLPPSDVFRPERFKKVVAAEVVAGALCSVGLYYLWYKKFPRSRFHFFNDNQEWLQMDKVGHATSAYTIAVIQHDLMRWCGVRPGHAIGISAVSALAYMSVIEVMDGFSAKWGFSKGDMLANMIGTGIFAAQQKWWGQQRASLKFSYHGSPFARYNPGELGNNWRARILKDYNGQTYWLSFNMQSFLGHTRIPAWANIAFGYGAEGMTGARENPSLLKGKALPAFQRYRQFYLSPDVDLSRIKSPAFLSDLDFLLQWSKFPAPALEYNTLHRLKLHGIYY